MKATIDESGCIGCGLCTATCPTVFAMGDEGTAVVICDTVPSDALGDAEKAENDCPVSVISLTE